MREMRIFLGTDDFLTENLDVLSIENMRNLFYDGCRGLINNVCLEDSNSHFSDSTLKWKQMEEKIQSCHLCILDITSIAEHKAYAKHIETIYKICLAHDKKMILLHHFLYPIDDWVKLAKPENVLDILGHDGLTVRSRLTETLNHFFVVNQRTSTIFLEDNNYLELANLLSDWYYKIKGNWEYQHIYLNENTFEIHYQGHYADTLFRLLIDFTKVSFENRKPVEKIMLTYIQNSFSLFNTVCHNEKKKFYKKYKV